jgi:hypothetical protein
MFKNMEQLFKRWHARTLTVSALVAAAILVAAPSLARVSQSAPAPTCSGTTPSPTPQIVDIDPGPPLSAIDINIDPKSEEVEWTCNKCTTNQRWVVIFNQTRQSPFNNYIFDLAAQHSGCPTVKQLKDPQNFGYIVYVDNQYLDPQVIIKGTGIEGGRRKKGKDTH